FDSYDFGINDTKAFFLDLSVNWTTSTPAFNKINNLFNVPMFDFTTFSALNKSGLSLIYAYGGLIPNNIDDWTSGTFVKDFYKVDVTSYPFSISPVISGGISPGPLCDHKSIFDDKGKLYIWGGQTAYIKDQTMYIFDTFDSTWSQILPLYVPAQRSSYTATFKNGKIYFIGGIFQAILIYDIDTNDPWTINYATNNFNISNRYAHSAVLAPNNQSIILYGGLNPNDSIPADYLITLDLRTFEFSEIVTKNKPSIDDVSAYHTTTVIYNNYMIVCFGDFPVKNPNRNVIRVLDLKDSTWIDNFETISTNPSTTSQVSNSSTKPTPPNIPTNNVNKNIIVSSIVGSIIF
ncbi:2424_t:CDS:2, partial [Ambispora leptoticha]